MKKRAATEGRPYSCTDRVESFMTSNIVTQEPIAVHRQKRAPRFGSPIKLNESEVELEVPTYSKLHYTRGALHARDFDRGFGTQCR